MKGKERLLDCLLPRDDTATRKRKRRLIFLRKSWEEHRPVGVFIVRSDEEFE